MSDGAGQAGSERPVSGAEGPAGAPGGPGGSGGRPPDVVAIVAAKDAEATVGETVSALLALAAIDEVVVVDDGSSDATGARARAAGAWVLRLPSNRGKGAAVAAGVALAPHARTYLLVDADVGPTASAVCSLLEPVGSGRADMAVGVLPGAGRKGGFGVVKRLARAGIRRGSKGGHDPDAPLSGQRAVRGDLLRSLELAERYGLESAMSLDAARAGASIVEVPVEMTHRHMGRSPAGFAHRLRQGEDVVRALWPRLTTSAGRLRLVAIALLVAMAGAVWSGSRWEATSVPLGERAAKVLVFGMPGLRWDEVGTGALPNLDHLVDAGALAAMTVRTLSRQPNPTEAYATIGAGARVRSRDSLAVANGVGEGGPVVVAATRQIRAGEGSHVPSAPGSLGEALHAAGLRTAVVGNSDTPSGLAGLPGLHPTRRPAALAVMDSQGRVDAGTVDPDDLLLADRAAPFGERADPDKMVARTSEALTQADVVVVDPGDLDRAADLSAFAPPGYASRFRSEALHDTDALLGRVVAAAPSGTLVMVLSTRPPTSEWRLTPLVAAGPGVPHGHIHSPSTRRFALATITDIAPTILDALGASRYQPSGMIGHALRYHPGTPDPERLGHLDRDIAFRERIYLPVALGFIAFQLVAYLVIGFAVSRVRRPRWAAWLKDVALAIAAFPLATLLFRLVTPFAPRLDLAGVLLLPLLILTVVAVARRARRSPLAPLAWVFGVTTAVLLVDVASGGRLQVGGILGYSPQSAGRFYGLGNTAFAVLAACTLLVAALYLRSRPHRRGALALVAALFLLTTLVDGAPGLGDDVGGILTLVPVFGLTVLAFTGRRLSWRQVAAVAGIAVAVLALATAVDLLRPPGARTHLGRLASDTFHHGPAELWTTIGRKMEANLRLLRLTPWSWVVPIIAAFLLYVLVVRKGWAHLLPPGSPLRIGVVSALAAGVLGFVVNDSGVVVTALVLVEVGPLLAVLALDGGAGATGPPVLLEPASDAPARPGRASFASSRD